MSATYIPSPVADPADLPVWLRTDVTPLDAVFAHDAADIAAAIEATGTTDLPTLLGHLTPKDAA